MNAPLLKLLEQRCKLAIGSLALVEKQLEELLGELDKQLQMFYAEAIRGEEENSDLEFFISPPISAYADRPEVDDES